MRPLAFASNAFKKTPLHDAIDSIASSGYRAVELMADLHHAAPLTFDAHRRRETRKQLDGLGLAVSNVNAFTHFIDGDTYHPTWIEADARRRRQRIDHTLGSIEIAHQFGCRTVSLQPGGPLIGTGLSSEDARQRFADSLSGCVPAARAAGVILAIEPEPGLLIQSAAEYLAFKQAFFPGEPTVAMNCDIGHLFCVGDDPAAVIRDLPGEIAHIHLEDIAANRVHQHLTPGKGCIRFSEIFAALDTIAFSGWTTVELYPYEADAATVAAQAITHLRELNLS